MRRRRSVRRSSWWFEPPLTAMIFDLISVTKVIAIDCVSLAQDVGTNRLDGGAVITVITNDFLNGDAQRLCERFTRVSGFSARWRGSRFGRRRCRFILSKYRNYEDSEQYEQEPARARFPPRTTWRRPESRSLRPPSQKRPAAKTAERRTWTYQLRAEWAGPMSRILVVAH